MDFKEFNSKLMSHIAQITKEQEHLFEVDINKDEMWEVYLESFPLGTNEIFRQRREFDCNCCKNFIRNLGNVVSLKNRKITSIWDFNSGSEKFQPVIDTLSKLVKSKPIRNVFLPAWRKFGTQAT